jgi:lipoprotein-anchoring transpeptidase ErfK/SrfK
MQFSIIAMRSTGGQIMAQGFFGIRMQRSTSALLFAAVMLAPSVFSSAASAQVMSYASQPRATFPSDNLMPQTGYSEDSDGGSDIVPDRLRRAVVAYNTAEAPGTIIIDTPNTTLYYVLGQGRAVRYGVGVGREGFTWSGTQTISRKAEWPDWHPPAEMIARQPYLPRFMAGGPGNPLGARAMYLGSSVYRIHGTNDPSTIGKFVSSGCIRLTNEDVEDLFSRVNVGTKVVVLPKAGAPHIEARTASTRPVASRAPHVRISTARSDRQAMNLSSSTVY